MSHIVTIETQLRDPVALRAACERMQLRPPEQGRFALFSTEAAGLRVDLPGWKYPVICDTATGQVQYDNFEGRWGEQAELDRFLQMYAAEKVKLEARKAGHSVTEQSLADGSIKLTIQVTGEDR